MNVALGPIVADLGGSLSARSGSSAPTRSSSPPSCSTSGAWADRIGSRRAFLIGLGVFGRGERRVRGGADDGGADRGARRAGPRRRAADALLAGADHPHVPGGPARRGALAAWGGISSVGIVGRAGPRRGAGRYGRLATIFLVNLPVAAWSRLSRSSPTSPRRPPPPPLRPPRPGPRRHRARRPQRRLHRRGSAGWTRRRRSACWRSAPLAALAFSRVERAVPMPMIPPEIFRNRQFSHRRRDRRASSTSASTAPSSASRSAYHESLGLCPLGTGLALLPLVAVIDDDRLHLGPPHRLARRVALGRRRPLRRHRRRGRCSPCSAATRPAGRCSAPSPSAPSPWRCRR